MRLVEGLLQPFGKWRAKCFVLQSERVSWAWLLTGPTVAPNIRVAAQEP